MPRKSNFSLEVRERAVRLVSETRPSHESEWAAITSVAVQYLSIRYTERLAEVGIEASVGSKGDSYDNALAEAVNSLFKAEVIYRRGPWKSREDVELAMRVWVDWFNNRRLLEPLGYVPPMEFEAAHYDKQPSSRRPRWCARAATPR